MTFQLFNKSADPVYQIEKYFFINQTYPFNRPTDYILVAEVTFYFQSVHYTLTFIRFFMVLMYFNGACVLFLKLESISYHTLYGIPIAWKERSEHRKISQVLL